MANSALSCFCELGALKHGKHSVVLLLVMAVSVECVFNL